MEVIAFFAGAATLGIGILMGVAIAQTSYNKARNND